MALSFKKFIITYKIYFITLFVFFCLTQVTLRLNSDDFDYLNALKVYNGFVSIITTFYFATSRFITDTLTVFLLQFPLHFILLLNSLMITFLSIVISYLFTERKKIDVIIVCILVSLLPIFRLIMLAPVSISSNYIWTIFCFFLLLLPIIYDANFSIANKHISNKPTFNLLSIVLLLASSFVALSQEQTMVVILFTYFCYTCYLFYIKRINSYIVLIFIYLIIIALFLYFSPGHLMRVNNHNLDSLYNPPYNEWSILDKLYNGYTTTIANLIYENNIIIYTLVLLLAINSFFEKKLYNKIILNIPLLINIYINAYGSDKFIIRRTWISSIGPLNEFKYIVSLIVSIIICISIVYSLFIVTKNIFKRFVFIYIFIISLMCRMMMGFSNVLYISGIRTFSLCYFLLIILNILLYVEMKYKITNSNVFKG